MEHTVGACTHACTYFSSVYGSVRYLLHGSTVIAYLLLTLTRKIHNKSHRTWLVQNSSINVTDSKV